MGAIGESAKLKRKKQQQKKKDYSTNYHNWWLRTKSFTDGIWRYRTPSMSNCDETVMNKGVWSVEIEDGTCGRLPVTLQYRSTVVNCERVENKLDPIFINYQQLSKTPRVIMLGIPIQISNPSRKTTVVRNLFQNNFTNNVKASNVDSNFESRKNEIKQTTIKVPTDGT